MDHESTSSKKTERELLDHDNHLEAALHDALEILRRFRGERVADEKPTAPENGYITMQESGLSPAVTSDFPLHA